MTKMLHVYRPRHFQITWFEVNQPSGCRVPVSTRFQECLSCPWACPLCPHGQMTMMWHIYRPRKFQCPWFGVNRPSGYSVLASARPWCYTSTGQDGSKELDLEWIGPVVTWVPASARFQEPLSRPWACPLCAHGQITMMLHLYRLRQFQFDLEWIGPVVAEFQHPQNSRSPYHRFQEPLFRPWPYPCDPNGQMTMMLHI